MAPPGPPLESPMFLMVVSPTQKYKPVQSQHNKAIIETTTPP